MALEFEWDETKAAANRSAHKVSFEEATTERGDRIRIISARKATAAEKLKYAQG